MSSSVIDFIYQRKDHYITRWKADFDPLAFNDAQSEALADELKMEMIDILLNDLYTEEQGLEARLRRLADRLIHYGFPLGNFIRGLHSLRRLLRNDLAVEYAEESLMEFEARMDDLVSTLVDESAKTRENIIDSQNHALKELSVPLIPVFDDISVMALIGTIDTTRAQHIMENLLEGIVEHRAQVVLIDITGVPVVDTMVAHHIIKVYEAVRLVGAQCILVGIRPEIAQTIVNLGIDLRNFSTKSTLQKGVEAAMEITNREIKELPRA
ncbi:STAS domain-containing protein [Salicibibacter halophilus]|uniref:STAS domain-containing protein n=1 Tax=Salicibibacter halophilus TaxID=2502791 RepID=A0A514LMH6_9BACI|nr:STAS domain-containing protein [Salicibibacter halophilus]QDI92471.1 STAS domain-containing protein [Salicibibacter halophilus]